MKTGWMVAALTLAGAPALAQGWIEPPDLWRGPQVERLRTAVDVRIDGRVAHVRVEEWFRNAGGGLAEGDYLYPLPGEAIFNQFSLFQGDEELRGEMMDAGTARSIYEEIVRRKRDPALIELVGHGLVRARVFPIGAGDTRKITLRYTQVLRRSGDALAFRYAAGGRYGGPRGDGGERPTPEHRPAPIAVTLTAAAGGQFANPFSPTHRIAIDRADGELRARVADDLTGDLAIFLPFARPLAGVTLVTHRPVGEDGYFMLTLSPGQVRGPMLPRDLTVVLDISGSMSGSKLDQAKRAIRQLLNTLGDQDRFRLFAFSGSVRAYRADWSPGHAEAREAGVRWIHDLEAGGGTDIGSALRRAFDAPSSEGRLPIVLFLTDGLPSVGEEDPERIAAAAERDRGAARVFAFGMGHDVNTYLLDRLSAAGRGSTEYVQPGEDVEASLSQLAAKIQHPVLTDLRMAGAPVTFDEVYPRTLPDLFAGDELVVLGRYRGEQSEGGELRMTGRRNGRVERFGAAVTFPAEATENDFVARLWAARKIGELSRDLRLNGHNDELVEEIRRTALRYGVLSEYTSYLVQEPMAVADVPVRDSGVRGRLFAQAPAMASGAVAVQSAERSRVQRESKTMADIGSAEADLLAHTAGSTNAVRHVAGRLFEARDGRWTELGSDERRPTITVAPFSTAYFAVLRALPELEPYAAAFEHVLVAGDGVNIEIADGGKDAMTGDAIRRLVRAFRGQ